MFLCRLFHRDAPFEQIDARLLAEGELTIGRDPDAGWCLDDRDGVLSRIHCTLRVLDGALTLHDRSTNGTFLEDGSRAPKDAPVPLAPRQSIRLGALTIFVDAAPLGSGDPARTIVAPPSAVPGDWIDAPPAPLPHRDASLIEAFCEGAKLDASALSGEDPVELMRRLGAIYQHSVLGLATLIGDRGRLKGAHDLDRTTIGAVDNNPFKWTPSRKLAQDLLCARPHGYLTGVDAVRASFDDVTEHLGAVAAAAEDAVAAVVQHLSPESIAAEADGRGFSLRSRAAACWDIYGQRHAALAGPGASFAARAFRDGYAAACAKPKAA